MWEFVLANKWWFIGGGLVALVVLSQFFKRGDDEDDEELLATPLHTGRTLGEELKGFRGLAKLFDTQFNILGFKFGLDSLVGLVPVAGDVMAGLVGLYALGQGFRFNIPWSARLAIVRNILVDTGLGTIPFLGDLFDFFFRSNAKNLKIVETHLIRMAKESETGE